MSIEEARPFIERARRFAALSGPFDPGALLNMLGDVSADAALAVTVNLANACDTSKPSGWLMRGTVRRRELAALKAGGALDSEIRLRRQYPRDPATEALLDALAGVSPYTGAGITHLLEPPLDRDSLARVATALDRAGPQAAAHQALASVRSALGRFDADARAQLMQDRGFYGRHAEIAQAERWLSRPFTDGPVAALYITGLPGIGKSTLIDETARRAGIQAPPWLVVRLDFDRGGLDIQDQVGLTVEISRQVALESGPTTSPLRQARLAAAGAGSSPDGNIKGSGRQHIPQELSRVLGETVRAVGRPVLLILDTVEVLGGRGETHPLRLFETIDELCRQGLRPLAVIAAGRGPALESVPERVGERIELGGLDDENADRLLSRYDAGSDMFQRIREVSDGIPLLLRLAALAVRQSGPMALEGVSGRGDLAAVYLYRFLLSRTGDENLRLLAQPGLLIRRLNPDVIAEVLAPHVGLDDMRAPDAVAAFEALATQHWLVEPDAVPGWVRHRPDVRASLLELLYNAGEPSTTAGLNLRAARWFERRPEPFAQLEAAYHRLQAMRSGGRPPRIAPEILQQLDRQSVSELPAAAQDLVRDSIGLRTSKFRRGSKSALSVDHEGAARELEATLERGDVREAAYVYGRSFGQSPGAPHSPASDVARSFLWRAGRWSDALHGFDPHRYFDGRFRERAPTTTLAHLEMWAESGFAALESAFTADPGLAELATELRERGFNGSLANGALGFALVHTGAPELRSSWGVSDPVDAAAVVWSPTTTWVSGVPSPQVLDSLAVQASRFAANVSSPTTTVRETNLPVPRAPDLATPAGAARVLASATPYGPVTETMQQLDPGDAMLRHLARTDFELAEAGGLPPRGAGDWSISPAASPGGSIQNLAALGLLAEWLGAAAVALRRPDLRLLARSSERWRRTSAGQWAYPSRLTSHPPSWTRRPDETMVDRIAQLDSEEACLEQIRIWSGAVNPGKAWEEFQRLRRRYPAADREARRSAPDDAAAALLARHVPSAFVPPMAVLYSFERKWSL
ncbi:ATP-binding protein [Pseudarthrobacter sp. AB1]|uniref:ATP-binding protein n=1 Tax=Pseudarthrobacter sp. AB1 TaxID=2138309 RepID=UPI00186B7A75|nr:ATP-binding protein [Pseudarthrobacter sp. AB1]MBE4720424.1 hypothetical protein [Pseudarthrobacter sp. AB1]